MRRLLLYLCALFIIGCSNEKLETTKLIILADFWESHQAKDSFIIHLKGKQVYPEAHEFEFNKNDSFTLFIQTDSGNHNFKIPSPGLYIISLSKDTLVNMPVDYASSSAVEYQNHISSTIKNFQDERVKQKWDSLQTANRELEENKRTGEGKSNLLFILPNQQYFVSANKKAKVFAFENPPYEIKVQNDDLPEYYELRTLEYFIKKITNRN